ncbi:unnamed protein product [Heligmosomoides polygyrus]|uniref:Uncharacterized protein n=1 Tax=Heligmosomoides polygyrus TaxID=6339 RepID=A0A3P7ZZJ3_HELPZ|nr:unnamed protein product [Heligmosomoides polygyrus]
MPNQKSNEAAKTIGGLKVSERPYWFGTGLLPSLHPHQSTAWKLAHRRPPRRPVAERRSPRYT